MEQAIRKSALVFLPDSLQLNSVGFLEGFSGFCEDTQAFFVLSKKLKSSSVDSIGYVSEVTPENGKVNNCRSTVEWLHINGNTGEMKICGSDSDVEYCVTCIRYDYRLFVESEAVLIDNKKYGVYFETLVKSLKNKCLKKYREKRKTVYGLIVFIFKLFGIVTNFCSEVTMNIDYILVYNQCYENSHPII